MRAIAALALLVLGACAPAPPDVDPAKLAAVAALPPPYNEADYRGGRRVFAQCRSCHVIAPGAPHRVGPNLYGVFGRKVGTSEDFTYSEPLQQADFVWDPEHLDHWLQNPQAFLPGNRMAFAGVRDPAERRDLLAYLMVEASWGRSTQPGE